MTDHPNKRGGPPIEPVDGTNANEMVLETMYICPCVEVRYDPAALADGGERPRWICVNCGVEFIRDMKPNVWEMNRQLQALELRVRQLEGPTPVIMIAMEDGSLTAESIEALTEARRYIDRPATVDSPGMKRAGVERRRHQHLITQAALEAYRSDEVAFTNKLMDAVEDYIEFMKSRATVHGDFCEGAGGHFSQEAVEAGRFPAHNGPSGSIYRTGEGRDHVQRITRAALALARDPNNDDSAGKLADATSAYILYLRADGRCPVCERKAVYGHEVDCPEYP